MSVGSEKGNIGSECNTPVHFETIETVKRRRGKRVGAKQASKASDFVPVLSVDFCPH